MPKFRYNGSYLSCFLMYAFYFGALALFSGLISVYLLGKDFSSSQVSLVVSCSLVASMAFQPVVGWLNDRFSPKLVTSAALGLSAVCGVLFTFAENIVAITILYSLTVGLSNSGGVVIERSATQSRYPYRYIRIWGTIGYAVCSQLGGVIYRYVQPSAMFIFFALAILLCVAGLCGMEGRRAEQDKPSAEKESKTGIVSRPFVLYVLIACIFSGITGLNSTYMPDMFQKVGIPIDSVGTITFALTLTELPFIFFSHKFMDRFSNTQLIAAIFIAQMAQYAIYALVPVPAVQIAAAILFKASSTMTFIMINLKAVAAIAGPSRQMTALALVATFRSLASVLFQMIGGCLLEHMTYPTFYLTLAGTAAVGLALCLVSRLPDGREQKLFA